MIQSFKNEETARVFRGAASRAFPHNILKRARRKLLMLHVSEKLEDLRIPPGNRLEALQGNRRGEHSIRINQKWRICFVWKEDGPYQVELSNHYE